MPNEEELIAFVKKRNNLVNFSMIAKHFGINNATVFDLTSLLEKKKVISVKKIGGSKLVMVTEK